MRLDEFVKLSESLEPIDSPEKLAGSHALLWTCVLAQEEDFAKLIKFVAKFDEFERRMSALEGKK